MKRLSKQVIYQMSAQNSPALKIDPGEGIIVETMDVFGNQIQTEADQIEKIDRSKIHPATGPIYLNGAQPGDTLKVDIQEIRPKSPAVQGLVPNFGLLKEDFSLFRTALYPIKEDKLKFEHLSVPLRPMIGTIGTAPAKDSIPCNTPGSHGGNLDTVDIAPGATLYLPIFVEGALLALGDVHACQADGEVSGISAEVAATVKLVIDVIKDRSIKGPQISYNGRFITLGSAETLEEASKKAVKQMINYLNEKYDFPSSNAYQLCTLLGNLRISQVVNPLKTVRFEIDIDFLET